MLRLKYTGYHVYDLILTISLIPSSLFNDCLVVVVLMRISWEPVSFRDCMSDIPATVLDSGSRFKVLLINADCDLFLCKCLPDVSPFKCDDPVSESKFIFLTDDFLLLSCDCLSDSDASPVNDSEIDSSFSLPLSNCLDLYDWLLDISPVNESESVSEVMFRRFWFQCSQYTT